jgi:outer membrane protein assembly factor BamB
MYLYIGVNGNVSAIDPNTGNEVWRTPLPLVNAFGSTVVAPQDVCILEHEGRVYAGCAGHLFALDASTGQILWRNQLKGLNYNDVTLAIAGKSIQYVSSHSVR